MGETEAVDTRQRFTVTAEITLKVDSPDEAIEMVQGLLGPLVMVKPFSETYPPKVVKVRPCDGPQLNANEAEAFAELMEAAGIDAEEDE